MPGGWPGAKGAMHPTWKGGVSVDDKGYVRRYAPEHPWPRKSGFVKEHVRLMELKIGRQLLPHECVHHKDENPKNNDPDNLELTTKSEHARRHRLADIHLRSRDERGRLQ